MSETDNVAAEAHALFALRPKISAAECATLRRYAWRRSEFPQPDDRLSETTAAWRKLFFEFDHQLEITLGVATKQKLDEIEKRGVDLELAQRALKYRMKVGTRESHAGLIISIAALVVGLAVGWRLFHGIVGAATVGALTAFVFTICSAVVLQDTWSSSFSARCLNLLGRILGAPSLRDAAARLINTNVLNMDEYYKTGDPARIADGVRAAEDLFDTQDGVIHGGFQIIAGEEYQKHVRAGESHLVETEMTTDERLAGAKAVVESVDRVRTVIFNELDRASDELDVELLEIQRQATDLPKSARRDLIDQWLSCARKEYLKGKLAANVLRNRLELDCCIATAVVGANGSIDVVFQGEEFAQQAASSFWLPELQNEKTKLAEERNRLKTQLFGVLG